MVTLLSDRYGELPKAVGLTSTGHLLEVLASVEGETWTILATGPTGISCVVSAGEGLKVFLDIDLGPEA